LQNKIHVVSGGTQCDGSKPWWWCVSHGLRLFELELFKPDFFNSPIPCFLDFPGGRCERLGVQQRVGQGRKETKKRWNNTCKSVCVVLFLLGSARNRSSRVEVWKWTFSKPESDSNQQLIVCDLSQEGFTIRRRLRGSEQELSPVTLST
jgi:hypothetical protein